MAEGTSGVTGDRAAAARGSLPGPPPLRVAVFPRGPVLIRCTAPDALSNLVAVLELAADGRLRCAVATRRPLAATVRLVDDALVAGDYYGGPEDDSGDGGEPIAAFAWPMLLQAGGLARLAGDQARADPARPGGPGPALLPGRRRPVGPVARERVAGRVRPGRGDQGPAQNRHPDPAVSRRAAVTAGLAALEPGVWVDVDAFFAILRTQAAPLAVTAGPLARWGLYLEDPRHGSLGPAGWKAWDIIEGRYALCVLFEYAATLGVVDVAYAGPRGARRRLPRPVGRGRP